MKKKRSNKNKKRLVISISLVLTVALILFFVNRIPKNQTANLSGVDLVLVDNENFVLVDEEDRNLLVNETIQRPSRDKNLWYYSEKVFEDGDNWYVKTSTDKNINVWLETVNKNDLSVKRTEFPGVDINVMTFDGSRLIASDNKVTSLDFVLFDKELNHQNTVTLPYRNGEAQMIFDSQLTPIEGGGYHLLIGFMPVNMPYDYNENHLLQLDSDFNVVNDMDLGLNDGSLSSFCILNNKIFASVSRQGIGVDGRGAPSNQVLVYDLNSGNIPETTIELDVTSGGTLKFDQHSGKLILQKADRDKDPQTPFVLIDPETYATTDLPLPEDVAIEYGPNPFTYLKNGRLYWLNGQNLLTWDLNTLEVSRYSLNSIVENGRGLLITDHEF